MRVVKIGGSLLEWDELSSAIETWLRGQPPMHNVWIVGGGQLVEGLRRLHIRFQLDERDSHWQAVEMLNTTARAIANLFPEWSWCDSADAGQISHASNEATNTIVAPASWLRTQTQLPETWEVTSDSIAACLAAELNAAELVLLKSADPPSTDLSELAGSGYCDPWFPSAAASIDSIRIVNLRKYAS